MYVAMNRFQIVDGMEQEFEEVWRSRDSRLQDVPGFVEFHLLKGSKNDETNTRLYASHTIWQDQASFVAWTQSEHFRQAHKNAGNNKHLYAGPPKFEGFEAVI